MTSGLTRNLLLVFGDGVSFEQSAAQLVMMPFIRLNLIAIKLGSFAVAASFTKVDEALISNQRDSLSSELTRGHSRSRALKLAQIFKQRRIAALARIDSVWIDVKRPEPLCYQAKMFRFVSALPRECEFYVEF
jgi:hypothetical protein